MVMRVVRNGNCSTGAVALDDLAVAEEVAEAAEPEAAVPEAAADDEAWLSGQLPTNDVVKKGVKIDTITTGAAAITLLKLNSSLLVRGCAVGL
jgi:hypothetical protein